MVRRARINDAMQRIRYCEQSIVMSVLEMVAALTVVTLPGQSLSFFGGLSGEVRANTPPSAPIRDKSAATCMKERLKSPSRPMRPQPKSGAPINSGMSAVIAQEDRKPQRPITISRAPVMHVSRGMGRVVMV